MLTTTDAKKLAAAQQAIDIAQKALSELYKAENQLLAEHAFEQMEVVAKVNLKLQRLLTVTKMGAGE